MAKPLYYDAGVYAIVSKKTGAMYIGATCFLTKRFATHVNAILCRHRRGYIHGPLAAFADHREEDLELRILERVQVEQSRRNIKLCFDTRSKPGRAVLLERERFWIRKLRPSQNKRKFIPSVGVAIPIQEPDPVALGA